MLTQIYCDVEGIYLERVEKDFSISYILRNKFKDIQSSPIMKKITSAFKYLILTYSVEIDSQGPTFYVARLLSSIWNFSIEKLNCNQLQYINDVLKRLIELINEI